jgi:hypothetical protein
MTKGSDATIRNWYTFFYSKTNLRIIDTTSQNDVNTSIWWFPVWSWGEYCKKTSMASIFFILLFIMILWYMIWYNVYVVHFDPTSNSLKMANT